MPVIAVIQLLLAIEPLMAEAVPQLLELANRAAVKRGAPPEELTQLAAASAALHAQIQGTGHA